jgi:hypothetical protein
MASRCFYAEHRPARRQVSSGLVPGQQRCPVLMLVGLLYDASSAVHLRSPCHLVLDASTDAFSSTLTTVALYHRSST